MKIPPVLLIYIHDTILFPGIIAFTEFSYDDHVQYRFPSEILGDSLALYVDTMYGRYVDGAVQIEKAATEKQTENGDADSDARHWDQHVLKVLEEHADTLKDLFNADADK